MNFAFINAMHGWTTPEKAEILYDLTLKAKPKIAVEIGVWGGRGTIPVAMALQYLGGGKVLAIDPWNADESAKGQIEPISAEWWKTQNHEAVYQSFLFHLKRQGVEKFVEVRRETSAKTPVPAEIGLLIVDGNHSEQALADAQRFAPNVVLGGYCLLDDLNWTGGYVLQAEQFIKSIGFAFVRLIDGQTGLYQRIEMAAPKIDYDVMTRQIPDEPARLTVAYVTARQEPMFEWFFDSLANQLAMNEKIKIIVVDALADKRNKEAYETYGMDVKWTLPKPTIWQGKHRITKEDWWAASNARNTAICLCETDWIAFLDDRCVLLPSWLDAVKKAVAAGRITVGSYEKRSKMIVEKGFIKGFEKLIGADPRLKQSPMGMSRCPSSWFFGCTFALPLDAALRVNGFEEGCDGLSMEDSIFGLHLHNAGYQIDFDPNMRMIEDRTEGETSSGHNMGGVMKRSDKGVSPNDKSHAALKRFGMRKETEFTFNLTIERNCLKNTGQFSTEGINPDARDWYDGTPIAGI
jgi:Methyltransferase domain/Glycosyl transferase family 2